METSFTQRAVKGKLSTQEALQGHSKLTRRALKGHLGTRALKAFGHLGTPALEVLDYSKDTWALGHSGTQAPRHSGTQTPEHLGTQGTLFSRLSIEIYSDSQKWLGIELL